MKTIGNYEAGPITLWMKRSSKTTPRDGAPRSTAEGGTAVLGEGPVGILRTVICLANTKLAALRAEERKKREEKSRRKFGPLSRRKEERKVQGKREERKKGNEGKQERRRWKEERVRRERMDA